MGKQSIALAMVLVSAALVGCESVRRDLDLARRSHSFEPKLFVAHASIPHLKKSEWEEIRDQFMRYSEYHFRDADRLSEDVIRVSLELKSDQYKGIQLRFEKKSGHWIENPARAEKVDYLIP
jgi:hypothetical protein